MRPDPEVVAQAQLRRFTADYKQGILAQAAGGVGALLRREGLYSPLLTAWRREAQTGMRQALTPKKRGPKSNRDALQEENQKLQKENVRLVEELRKAAIVIDILEKGGAVGVADQGPRPERAALMTAVSQLAPTVGVAEACEVLGVPRASFYRQPVYGPAPARPTPPRSLSQEERETVCDLLNSPRFVDCAPAAIQATLLNEGQYLCSTRTMYRILDQDGGTRERRDQLTHPA